MTTRSSAPTRRRDEDEAVPVAPRPARQTGAFWRLAACALLFLFGAPLWLAGARYTLDGWLAAINFLAGWLHTPWRVPALEWRVYLGLVIGLGLAYSAVEVALYTTARARRLGRVPTVLWALWLLVLLTDIGSTFLGVIVPEPGAPPLAVWAAQTWVVAGIWSTVLTFAPEWLILGAVKLLRG